MFLKYDFRAFPIVVHQNKVFFFNPEAKRDKIGMLQYVDGVIHRPSKPKRFLPVVRLGVPRCRNFVVYPKDKAHPSVLHVASRHALACNFLYISFCMNEIENMKHIVVSSHFYPENQNNAKTCHKLHASAKTRYWVIP